MKVITSIKLSQKGLKKILYTVCRLHQFEIPNAHPSLSLYISNSIINNIDIFEITNKSWYSWLFYVSYLLNLHSLVHIIRSDKCTFVITLNWVFFQGGFYWAFLGGDGSFFLKGWKCNVCDFWRAFRACPQVNCPRDWDCRSLGIVLPKGSGFRSFFSKEIRI